MTKQEWKLVVEGFQETLSNTLWEVEDAERKLNFGPETEYEDETFNRLVSIAKLLEVAIDL